MKVVPEDQREQTMKQLLQLLVILYTLNRFCQILLNYTV